MNKLPDKIKTPEFFLLVQTFTVRIFSILWTAESRFSNASFSNLPPVTQTKVVSNRLASLSCSLKLYPRFFEPPISRSNFRYPRRFAKTWFQCRCTNHCNLKHFTTIEANENIRQYDSNRLDNKFNFNFECR